MDSMCSILEYLKERSMNNNSISYVDSSTNLNNLLKHLNFNKEECKVLYLSKTASMYIESVYNIKTESIIKTISNNQYRLLDSINRKDNEIYIINDCELLDLNTFSKLLLILSKEAKIILMGDIHIKSNIENNVFCLLHNIFAKRYLNEIKLEDIIEEFDGDKNDYSYKLCPNSKKLVKNLVKINDNLYSGIVNWGEFKELIKNNNAYTLIEKGLEYIKFNHSHINLDYLKRFIKNPYSYFQKTVIMSNENDINSVIENGVVTSNFLNIFYHIKIEEMKAKFIELEYPCAKKITQLNLSKLELSMLDVRIMYLIEKEFRIKYASCKDYFKNNFFTLVSLDLEMVLNQDRDYIFEYTLFNPDACMFIENENIIRLSVLKCYNLLELAKLDKNNFNTKSSVILKSKNEKSASTLLEKYNYYDDKLELIYNVPFTIFNLINWVKLRREVSQFRNEKLLVSDLGLSISNIEKIINFKLNMVDIIFEKYELEGLKLILNGKEESFFFNSLFRGICKYSYDDTQPIKYNICKMCNEDFAKIKKEFINSGDILYLDEFLEIKNNLKSDRYHKSSRILEYGFMEILNSKSIEWQQLFKIEL